MGFYEGLDIYEDFYSIEDVRKDLNRVVEYFQSQPWHEEAMRVALQEDRQLTPEIIKDCDAFFIPEDLTLSDIPDWMQHETLGMVYKRYIIRYSGRIVYPVKDVRGDVMGFCGWEKFSKEVGVSKYLDSKNYGYKAKETSLFGMENMERYYKCNEPLIVTEGPVCSLYLRSQGFQSLALLGSNATPYVINILNRFGNRLVLVPDFDEAGDTLVNKAKRKLKKAVIIQIRYGKDIDGCRKLEEHKYEKQLLSELRSLSNPFSKTEICIRR